ELPAHPAHEADDQDQDGTGRRRAPEIDARLTVCIRDLLRSGESDDHRQGQVEELMRARVAMHAVPRILRQRDLELLLGGVVQYRGVVDDLVVADLVAGAPNS